MESNTIPATSLPLNHISYYEVLGVPQDCSTKDVKSAYHRLLLTHHPDKKVQREDTTILPNRHSIQLIQDAYRTLSDTQQRKDYDAAIHTHFIKLGLTASSASTVNIDGMDRIDLSEFEVTESQPEKGGVGTAGDSELEEVFVHACPRCHFEDGFVLSETDLEQGTHEQEQNRLNSTDVDYQLLLQCASCSLWLCVTYSIS